MKEVRIGVILCILLSGFFVTFYGGTIPYRFFQCSLLVPVLCLIYTAYVYARFKIYQEVEHNTLVKEEIADYTIQVGNEDYIMYEHIKLNFYEDNSRVLDVEPFRESYLLPGEKKEYKTSVLCRYRGNYAIGVKSVQVTDFMHLFSITYPIKEPYNVTVLPKTISLDKCFFLEEDCDDKQGNGLFEIKKQEPDVEIRPYLPGDEKRMIDWKASAKYKELFTRKNMNIVKQGVIIYMEMLPPKEMERLAVEDKLLECVLAIAYYCVNHNTRCSMVYEEGEICLHEIRDLAAYDSMYQETAQLCFRGKLSADALLEECIPEENQIVVLVVLQIGDSLLKCISSFEEQKQKIIVLVMGEEPEEWDGSMIHALVLFIPSDGDVKKILEEGSCYETVI